VVPLLQVSWQEGGSPKPTPSSPVSNPHLILHRVRGTPSNPHLILHRVRHNSTNFPILVKQTDWCYISGSPKPHQHNNPSLPSIEEKMKKVLFIFIILESNFNQK